MWWIRGDLCGMISAAFTVLLLLYAQFVVVTVVLLPWYGFSLHVLLYTCLTLLALVSHCRAQFTNPGAIPLDRLVRLASADRLRERAPVLHLSSWVTQAPQLIIAACVGCSPRVCRRCRVLKPWKAHHCSSCGRCIIRMDHHCPWVNNCVAIHNQKYFLLFLVYTCLCCTYSGALLVGRFISCTNHLKSCTISGAHTVLCVLCAIEAVIFGLFTIIMLWDQLAAIFENTPGIDALQNKKGEQRGRYESLQEVFGERLNWRWWLPLDLPPKVQSDFLAELEAMDDPAQEDFRDDHMARAYEMAAATQARQQEQQQQNGHPSSIHSHAAASSGSADLIHAPIVFPDAHQLPHSRKSSNPLASLQSPPHSPTLQGLQARTPHSMRL